MLVVLEQTPKSTHGAKLRTPISPCLSPTDGLSTSNQYTKDSGR